MTQPTLPRSFATAGGPPMPATRCSSCNQGVLVHANGRAQFHSDRPGRACPGWGQQVTRDELPSGPELDMNPTLVVATITGPTVAQPIVTLHTSRQHAVQTLADWVRVHLVDLLGYEPTTLQGRPDLVTVQNELAGFTNLRADVQDVAVTL